jgi:DNA-binding MarR family transcriptional regulator
MADSLETADRVHSAAIRLLRMVRTADDETGLSAPRLSALSVLVFAGAQSLGALARIEQVTPPSMSKLVAELEASGLVAKRADKTDGRALRIEATAKGKALMHEGRKRRLALLRQRFAAFTAAERATLDKASALMQRAAE